MFNLNAWLQAKTERISSTKQRALIAIASQLGSVIVVAATFTLGYVVKNMEDHGAQRAMNAQLTDQRESIIAECNARIVQNDTLMNGRMAERDALLNDQSERLAEQTQLIQTLQGQMQTVTNTTNQIAAKQDQNSQLRKAEVRAVTTAAVKANTAAVKAAVAASAAVEVAKKGLTEDDRQQINAVAKGKGVKK